MILPVTLNHWNDNTQADAEELVKLHGVESFKVHVEADGGLEAMFSLTTNS